MIYISIAFKTPILILRGFLLIFKKIIFSVKIHVEMLKIAYVITLLCALPICSAGRVFTVYNGGDYAGVACKYALAKTALFCEDDYAASYDCYCDNIDAIGSYFYCGYQETHSKSEKHRIERFFKIRCPNVTTEQMRAAYKNVSDYIVNTSTIANFNKTKPVNFPVIYNRTFFEIAYQSNKVRYSNMNDGLFMGAGMIGYWGLVVLCGTIVNIMSKLSPKLLLSINRSTSQMAVVRYYRKYISLPATFRTSHTRRSLLDSILPTRLESIITFVFFVMVVLCEAIGYHHVKNGTFFLKKSIGISYYVGDRTGIISLYLMVLTYLFAGRNNILLWMTGWKQSTFVMYHKWIGRILFCSVLTHTLSMLTYTLLKKTLYEFRVLEDWWRWGAVAVVAGGIIMIQAFSWLRERSYEFFLNVHIILAVLFLVGAWRHVEIFAYGGWAYATAAIWCFDRFIRLVRIAAFGVRTAQVSIVSDETLKVTVGLNSWWPFFCGSYGYIYFLTHTSTLFWQSRPFTVVKADDGKLCIYIKIKKGATQLLYKKLLKEPNQTCNVKIAVEGPYGDRKPVETYGHALLYGGGNGIPGPYAYAKELAEAKEQAKTKFVKLYWVIRHWYSIDWFLEELKTLEHHENVQTIVYVTKYHEGRLGAQFAAKDSVASSSSDNDNDNDNEETEKISATTGTASESGIESILKALPHVEFREGRPDIAAVVSQDIDEAQGDDVAVVTCAHSDMCDEIRRIVASKVGDRKVGRIDLFEELQTW